jgi:peptide deformylase
MAVHDIVRMGHPVLRARAAEVPDPTAPEIRALVEDLIETMRHATGAGLAAPQIAVPLRVFVFHVPEARVTAAPGDAAQALTALINPVIDPLGPELDMGWEGCLSVPGMTGKVPRFTRIRYRGTAPDGALIEREAAGFHARVVQHEFDHLDGILFPMRMPDLSLFGFTEAMRESFPELKGQPDD